MVLIAKRSTDGQDRWVYLDIGRFNGLVETLDEMIRYTIRPGMTPAGGPCVLAAQGASRWTPVREKDVLLPF